MKVTSEELYKILMEVNTQGTLKSMIADDEDLFKIGALDSMAVVQFILAIEKKYVVKINKKDINFTTFTNLKNIKTLIDSKLT